MGFYILGFIVFLLMVIFIGDLFRETRRDVRGDERLNRYNRNRYYTEFSEDFDFNEEDFDDDIYYEDDLDEEDHKDSE